VVPAESVRLVVFDVPKVAVSVGTVVGLQLLPVLKSLLPGLLSQVALCAHIEPEGTVAKAMANANIGARILRLSLKVLSLIAEDARMSHAKMLTLPKRIVTI
jgi:hypothetical protein